MSYEKQNPSNAFTIHPPSLPRAIPLKLRRAQRVTIPAMESRFTIHVLGQCRLFEGFRKRFDRLGSGDRQTVVDDE